MRRADDEMLVATGGVGVLLLLRRRCEGISVVPCLHVELGHAPNARERAAALLSGKWHQRLHELLPRLQRECVHNVGQEHVRHMHARRPLGRGDIKVESES